MAENAFSTTGVSVTTGDWTTLHTVTLSSGNAASRLAFEVNVTAATADVEAVRVLARPHANASFRPIVAWDDRNDSAPKMDGFDEEGRAIGDHVIKQGELGQFATPIIGWFDLRIEARSTGGTATVRIDGFAEQQIISTGDIFKTDWDANTILAADTDDVPAALTLGASTVPGRNASGGIVALDGQGVLDVLQTGPTTHTPKSGTWQFGVYPHGLTQSNSANTWTQTANFFWAWPYWVPELMVITDLGIKVTTAQAAKTARLALYAPDGTDGAPSTREAYTDNALSLASTGLIQDALASAVTLQAGWHVAGYWSDSSTAVITAFVAGEVERTLMLGNSTFNVQPGVLWVKAAESDTTDPAPTVISSTNTTVPMIGALVQ